MIKNMTNIINRSRIKLSSLNKYQLLNNNVKLIENKYKDLSLISIIKVGATLAMNPAMNRSNTKLPNGIATNSLFLNLKIASYFYTLNLIILKLRINSLLYNINLIIYY